MSFAKFSSDYLLETFTLVDNLFINEYLPYCDEKQIKTYLTGLYLCANPASDNSLSALSQRLDMTVSEILSAYSFFEDLGLVRIISKEPLQVEYLSLKKSMQPPKKYRGEKWNDFNTHLQQMFNERMLTPNEYNEYYMFLDESKLSQDAMLMIVQYCINLKGESVRYPYILTVARNLVADGARTLQDVEQKLSEFEDQSELLRQVLSSLNRKGSAELEEKQMLKKWQRSWGYEPDAIIAAAKTLKGSKTFFKLDARLNEFYKLSIFTADEMKDWQARKDFLAELAIAVNKNLGVYYESFEHEIEVYIAPLLAKGFEKEALIRLAHHCFTSNVRSLEGFNSVANKFYQNGLLSASSIDEYLISQAKQDEKIKRILEASGQSRAVTVKDRDFYRTWSAEWGFDDEIIMYVASLANGKPYAVAFINQTLANFKANSISTLEAAKAFGVNDKSHEKNFDERKYSKEELRSIATSIDSLSEEDV